MMNSTILDVEEAQSTPCFDKQYASLEKVLLFDHALDNTLTVIALGGMSDKIRSRWWQSEASFAAAPLPILQDTLSLEAQYLWQQWRNNKALCDALAWHVQNCFKKRDAFRFDIHLHRHYPEMTLVKFWLTSSACCCRSPNINQATLWKKHLLLTRSLCIALTLSEQYPNASIGYTEHQVALIDSAEKSIIILSNKPFEPYQCLDHRVLFLPYPNE